MHVAFAEDDFVVFQAVAPLVGNIINVFDTFSISQIVSASQATQDHTQFAVQQSVRNMLCIRVAEISCVETSAVFKT